MKLRGWNECPWFTLGYCSVIFMEGLRKIIKIIVCWLKLEPAISKYDEGALPALLHHWLRGLTQRSEHDKQNLRLTNCQDYNNKIWQKVKPIDRGDILKHKMNSWKFLKREKLTSCMKTARYVFFPLLTFHCRIQQMMGLPHNLSAAEWEKR